MPRKATVKEERFQRKNRRIDAVDLFCGAGGLTHGLALAGVEVRLGVDIDPHCEYPYKENNRKTDFRLESVEDLDGEELRHYYRKDSIRLLAGCAPCQTFSTYNQKATESDKRWRLLDHFSRLVGEIHPDLVSMENVPRLQEQNVFLEFVAGLKKAKYFVKYKVVNCEEYGIPQHRSRLVLLASKFEPVELISAADFGHGAMTVKEAIGDLPKIEAGENCPDDPLHHSASLSVLNLRRIKSSKPGGTWRDWPRKLITDCHKKQTGKTYPSVYGRMTWDAPAPTITTEFFGYGSGRFGHPEQNRAISLREGAILQSFPADYKFIEPDKEISIKTIGRLIGNAVPVTLGKVIGVSLLSHVSSISPERLKEIKESRP